ncbi:hypothetical protein [Arthrobacter sp. CAN_A1]|uniref:hypothetical protein n=1 Tax=Arthrobacter sp. CAN_A1 TaxID=2787717 RepID=UPI0018C8FAC4
MTAASSTSRQRTSLRTAERIGLIIFQTLMALLTLLVLGALAYFLVLASQGRTELYLPAVTPEGSLAGLGPHVSDAYFDTVTLSVEGVSAAAMAPYGITMIAGFLFIAASLMFFLFLSLRIYRGRPFSRLMTVGLSVIATIFVAGSLILPAILSSAHSSIVADLGIPLADAPFTTGYYFGPADLLSLITGIFCGLFAGAFSIGSRLQRDTEGLI